MGLLDDAIREHLELKRRRGADPGEVARAEQEALAPVPREPSAVLDPGQQEYEEHQHAEPDREGAPQRATDFSSIGEETAEIDMREVLAAGYDPPAGEDPSHAAPEEDSLEWEMPGREERPPPPDIPGQESLTFE